MKNTIVILTILWMASINAIAGQADFTIAAVGQSNNTDTVYIETIEEVENTSCSNKNLLRLPDSDKAADRFFALALAAQAQNKKISIIYSESNCINNGSLVQVFNLKR